MTKMRLAILETGTPAEPLRAKFGGYFDMFVHAFAQSDWQLELVNFPVYKETIFPDARKFDGVLLTGSPYGVYEDHEFIPPLKEFIRDNLDTNFPMLGICFGHQIMAEALGGRVEKSTKGWGVGVHTYEINRDSNATLNTALFNDISTLSCLLSHQDQVISLSNEMKSLGGSDFCPNGIIEYGNGNGLSFQMHPEFTTDFAASLLESRRDRIAPETVSQAESSFSLSSDRSVMISIIIRFFDRNISKNMLSSSSEITEKEQCNV